MFTYQILSVCLLASSSLAFAPQPSFRPIAFSLSATTSTTSAAIQNVVVLEDASAVGDAVRKIVGDAAKEAIAERGYFALAIPGGSILKMLVGDDILGDEDWTSKTTIAYVNHKCVDMDDGDLATHAKARKLFLDKWTGANTIVLDGTDDGEAEAASYESKMKALSEDELPRDKSGLPVFDLALIGVGDDGHIGSLYPGRGEVMVGADGVSNICVDPIALLCCFPYLRII
jgi:6-phosphogluconolactonase